ncbi:hypothetical protein HZH68_003587 [Vespula germanica]|uniref:Uncharacterized protein n=1 Tax=Vespula germanica TaxID=30212 RepID=A0A834NPF9_VESGE|nr:hypothetical protein HZH68_003587 [Vespula germanica]
MKVLSIATFAGERMTDHKSQESPRPNIPAAKKRKETTIEKTIARTRQAVSDVSDPVGVLLLVMAAVLGDSAGGSGDGIKEERGKNCEAPCRIFNKETGSEEED